VTDPIEIPGGVLEDIILDLISVASYLGDKGEEASAAIINMVVDQLEGFMP
jgi:hypothetical protein